MPLGDEVLEGGPGGISRNVVVQVGEIEAANGFCWRGGGGPQSHALSAADSAVTLRLTRPLAPLFNHSFRTWAVHAEAHVCAAAGKVMDLRAAVRGCGIEGPGGRHKVGAQLLHLRAAENKSERCQAAVARTEGAGRPPSPGSRRQRRGRRPSQTAGSRTHRSPRKS